MLRVYLAAQYRQKDEIKQYALELKALGIEVTSSWLDEPHAPNTNLGEISEEQELEYANRDLDDIDRAQLLVLFSLPPTQPFIRGGRHVEFGYALGSRKPTLVVGPAENIFHRLTCVARVDTWEAAKVALVEYHRNLAQARYL